MLKQRHRWFIVIAFAAALAFACGSNPATNTDPTRNLSPAGLASYEATKVVKALDVLRDIAVSAESQKLLSTDNTKKVVLYHTAALKTIGAIPGGWKPVVLQGLDELSHQLTPAEWRQLAPFATLIKAVIQEVK